MEHYFFHIRTKQGMERDPDGIKFASLQDAVADARRGLLEMISEDLMKDLESNLLGIDVADGAGKIHASVNVGDSESP